MRDWDLPLAAAEAEVAAAVPMLAVGVDTLERGGDLDERAMAPFESTAKVAIRLLSIGTVAASAAMTMGT
jgi:hypothetical protein